MGNKATADKMLDDLEKQANLNDDAEIRLKTEKVMGIIVIIAGLILSIISIWKGTWFLILGIFLLYDGVVQLSKVKKAKKK